MKTLFFTISLALFGLCLCDNLEGEKDYVIERLTRGQKQISPFSIIRFQNGPCTGTGTKNGTCYTSDECTAKGGANIGTCAGSYGICCQFTGGCGSTFSENCTYFQPTLPIQAGACTLKICKAGPGICQLRLDFVSFAIAGPSTDTTLGTLKALNGQLLPAAAGAVAVNLLGSCSTDTFQVTAPGATAPPVICGTNTNEHMYVDASDQCNSLIFNIGQTTLATRTWSIKITQYSCDYDNLAPSGCTQYFFGLPLTQTVRSYNFVGGQHLASQNQNVCVRREQGQCRICWTTTSPTDFDVSGTLPAGGVRKGYNNAATGCCGYGTKGTKANGYDCVIIPGAQNNAVLQASQRMVPSQVCGRAFVTMVAAAAPMTGTVQATTCSESLPFSLRFLSDQYEFAGANTEGGTGDKGFQLQYTMDAKC